MEIIKIQLKKIRNIIMNNFRHIMEEELKIIKTSSIITFFKMGSKRININKIFSNPTNNQ